MDQEQLSANVSASDMAYVHSWAGPLAADPGKLPISFVYDEKRICGIPPEWNPAVTWRRIDANLSERVFEGTDPRTGLRVRVEWWEYADFPVVEWVAWFENTGTAPTPILRVILGIDAAFQGASCVLDHCNGDIDESGYVPSQTAIGTGDVLRFSPRGGRPCSGAFPYFRLNFEGRGLTLAVGWPGQWAAAFAGREGSVHVAAGQEETYLRLFPGERIRTPRMAVMAWVGGRERAINLWRRWYRAHVMPKLDGQPPRPLMACAQTDPGVEFTAATEENQLRYMQAMRDRGFDYDVWLMDAGWYPCRNEKGEKDWTVTGTWRPDPERFPNGLAPLADLAAKDGAFLWIWFEPERVRQGTEIDARHPEWLLKITRDGKESPNRLLNLGDPGCRRWITDLYNRLIAENGIRLYRQDYNIDPLPFWRENDEADRRGVTENKYVQGYLDFWDGLLAQNPGLLIDSCASGGRRNDLETMRRSVPLHYSDYAYGNHPVKIGFQHTLYSWIPYFKESTLAWDIQPKEGSERGRELDDYSVYCGMAPMILPVVDLKREDYDMDRVRKLLGIWRETARLQIHGDYYLLTPFSKSPSAWVARQWHLPESERGAIQVFRHREAEQDAIVVRPRGLLGSKRYRFDNPDTGEALEEVGARLMGDGLTLALPKRGAGVWFYQAVE